jgi:prefoldin subunit 5
MQIPNITGVSVDAGSSTTISQLASLQKQFRNLSQQIKDLATYSSLDAKTKQQESQLLQSQIVALQEQIAAIHHQQNLVNGTHANIEPSNRISKVDGSPCLVGVSSPVQVNVYV